ncbi:MAG: hypothetical protein WC460_06635 [Patescibacteria group bacterium]
MNNNPAALEKDFKSKIKASATEAILADKKKSPLKSYKKSWNSKFTPTKMEKREKALEEKFEAKSLEVGKELKKIYEDGQGNLPNMTKLEFKNKNRARNLVIGIIVFLFIILAASVTGFFIFRPNPKFSGDKIKLEIKAPFSLSSGENIDYQIKYTNSEEISLNNVQLTVNLPNGFIFSSSNFPPVLPTDQTPANLKTWKINDLYPGQSQLLDITGKLIGPIDAQQSISAVLNYVPANFSSEFQKKASFSTQISDSLANLEIEHANQIADQEEMELTLKLTNKSQQYEINNLSVELAYPLEFTIGESQIIDPNNEASLNVIKAVKDEISPKIWQIDSLLPQAEKLIKIKGKFKVEASAKPEFTVAVKLKGSGEDLFLQGEEKFSIEVIKGELLTNLIINGSNQNKAVSFGDTLNYLLSIENKSKKTLGDIKVRAVLDSAFLDWSSLKDDNRGINEDTQILWTKDQIPKLAFLLPEEEIEINFQIKLRAKPARQYSQQDYQVKSFFETQVNQIDNAEAKITNQSPTLINEFNSDLNLSAMARYFDDQSNTIGSGPLPPIVGQKTSYRIFWTITNSLHDLTTIEVKSKLPDYVTFEDKQNISTGDLFKNAQNEIIWQISGMPATIDKATAEFDISITPQAGDVGKILTLLPEITLTATDAQTKGQLLNTLSGITTNLDSDPLGKGKGLILAE